MSARTIVVFVLVLAAIGAALRGGVLGGTFALFSAASSNSSDSYAAGTVRLSDNDAGAAVLTLDSAKPGDSDTGCIAVTYGGSLPATVRLYASTSGALVPYVNLAITRGSDPSPSFRSCASFAADPTNYIGAGAGVVYSGPLSSFPTSYAGGLVDPATGAPGTWNTNDRRVYRLVLTLQDNNNAQGLTGAATLTWEARNS